LIDALDVDLKKDQLEVVVTQCVPEELCVPGALVFERVGANWIDLHEECDEEMQIEAIKVELEGRMVRIGRDFWW
jgi:hypothetical protein